MSDILRRINSRREWDAVNPPKPPRRKWWQILGDWLAERFPFLKGDNQP